MPKIAVFRNLVFFLYAYDLSERLHLHVSNNKTGRSQSAKIWLDTAEIFEAGTLTAKELKQAQAVIDANREAILKQIHHFVRGEKVELLNLNL